MEKSIHTKEYRALRDTLREMRLAAGFSQRQLGDALDVPHTWVAKVETGERRIDLVEFCWFAKACGQSPTQVLSQLLEQPSAAKRSKSAGGPRR